MLSLRHPAIMPLSLCTWTYNRIGIVIALSCRLGFVRSRRPCDMINVLKRLKKCVPDKLGRCAKRDITRLFQSSRIPLHNTTTDFWSWTTTQDVTTCWFKLDVAIMNASVQSLRSPSFLVRWITAHFCLRSVFVKLLKAFLGMWIMMMIKEILSSSPCSLHQQWPLPSSIS